jgi:hypothetical protein
MSWKDNLLPASFRDVEFYVSTDTLNFGRRNVLHEYPYGDTPSNEDLGKKGRTYTVSAFLLGDDYITQRNKLIKALEEECDAGTLILPTKPAITVIPTSCTCKYSSSEGGIEYFELSFSEAGERIEPRSNVQKPEKGIVISEMTIDNTIDYFDELVNNLDPRTLLDSATKDKLIDSALAHFGIEKSSFDKAIGSLSKADELAKDIRTTKNAIETGAIYNDYIRSSLGEYKTYTNDILSPLRILNSSSNLLSQNYNYIVYDVLQSKNMDIAISILDAGIWVANLAKYSINKDYSDHSELIEEYSVIVGWMDDFIFKIGDDENNSQGKIDLFENALTLKMGYIEAIEEKKAILPVERVHQNKDSIPVCVINYEYYANNDKIQIISEANSIFNPLFTQPNTEIKI